MITTWRNDGVARTRSEMCRRASDPYRHVGRLAHDFARLKLRYDPLYTDVLLSGTLAGCRDLVDLGCGQGLMAAWLHAAQAQRTQGSWPHGWPEPPRPTRIRGIDLRAAAIRRARAAWGESTEFRVGDIREADCGGADAVLLLDVAHYIDHADQERLLTRIRGAMNPGGVLILRVADASGGFTFRLAQWIDRVNDLIRDGSTAPFYCRPLQQWLRLLQSCGFIARPGTGSSGTSFSNTLLIARAA